MDYICGPYEVSKGNKRISFCILLDNRVSMRTYKSGNVTKNKFVKCNSIDEAMVKLEQLHSNKLQYRGYAGQHLGKVSGAPVKTLTNKRNQKSKKAAAKPRKIKQVTAFSKKITVPKLSTKKTSKTKQINYKITKK